MIGYVDSNYTAIAINTVKAEIDKWMSFYPMIDGIFIDQVTNDDVSAHSDYYVELSEYIHSKGLSISVVNIGTDYVERYESAPVADIIVSFENSTLPVEATLLGGNWAGSHREYDYSRKAVLVYNQGSLDLDLIAMLKKYCGFVYVTDDDLPNPWDTLSTYLADLYAAMRL